MASCVPKTVTYLENLCFTGRSSFHRTLTPQNLNSVLSEWPSILFTSTNSIINFYPNHKLQVTDDKFIFYVITGYFVMKEIIIASY